MKRRYPQSRWKKDAEALEIEVRNSTGHPVKPDDMEKDDDLFSLAFQGLMNNNPAAGIQRAEQILNGSVSPKKIESTFRCGAERVRGGAVAAGQNCAGTKQSRLQRKAVDYLGMFGGNRSANMLSEVYARAAIPE
jgi:hypothetical protein